jgi:hypothetical protein
MSSLISLTLSIGFPFGVFKLPLNCRFEEWSWEIPLSLQPMVNNQISVWDHLARKLRFGGKTWIFVTFLL